MELLIILLLILLNGLFSMSEIAIVSARKTRLEMAAKKGSVSAKAALEIANTPNRFLSTVQIGITLIGILTGMFSGDKLTTDIQSIISGWGLDGRYAHSVAVVVVVIIITFFSLVFGELVPKRIGLSNPEIIAKAVARPMNVLTIIAMPFVWLLTFTGDLIVRLLAIKQSSESKVTEEEIKAIIQEGTEGGAVQEIEQDIMERVFILGDRKVVSLMTSRTEVIFLDLKETPEEIRKMVSNELHSIYPVYEDTPDNIKGVVSLKDLFAHLSDENFSLSNYLKSPQFLTENTSVYKALQFFKEKGIHYGIITDEYGITKGIITMNDVLEALVGNVSEFYKDEYTLEQRQDGSYIIDGQYPFHDFLQYFGLEDSVGEYDFNTISGLVLQELQRIPKEGEKINWKEFELEVIDMDGARIDKMIIRQI
jgi:putative hemolysin